MFAGGCTLEAAEAVCAGEGVEEWEVLDLLGGLANKSLVQVQEASGEVRYGLLETVRQYGVERLAAAGGAEEPRDRHLRWYLGLAEEEEVQLTGPEQGTSLTRLEREHDNLRAALRWALDHGAARVIRTPDAQSQLDRGLRLGGALWRFWYMRGHLSEGRNWLGTLLARAIDDGAGLAFVQANALCGAGVLATSQGDYAAAKTLCEQSLALYQEAEDRQGAAVAFNVLGNVVLHLGDSARAVVLSEESLALHRRLGSTRGIAVALNNLGIVLLEQDDHERAAGLFTESLALNRELGDNRGIAVSLRNLGETAMFRGDYARAGALVEESLALSREVGDKLGIAGSLSSLGWMAVRHGEYERAAAQLHEALRLCRDLGAREPMAWGLESLAWLTAACEQPQGAARLGGAAEKLREAVGAILPLEMRADHDQAVGAMRTALGEEAFAAAWAEGRALPLEAAITEALDGVATG